MAALLRVAQLIIAGIAGFYLVPAMAQADPCRAAKTGNAVCAEPLREAWSAWRFLPPVVTTNARADEQDALQDAMLWLKREFPCGLSFSLVDRPFVAKSELWGWVSAEEAPRLRYVGYPADKGGSCVNAVSDSSGVLLIRRERKVRCPRDYTWFVRDDKPGVCLLD